MTKTLFLLRHGKSDWSKAGHPDHDRPLNARGKSAVPRVAAWLKAQSQSLDCVISSTAVRAKDTAFLVADELGMKHNVVILDQSLYLAEPETYVQSLTHLSPNPKSVMLVGHNPGISELATRLCSESIEMPTAALIQIELSISLFSELSFSTPARLMHFIRPREL